MIFFTRNTVVFVGTLRRRQSDKLNCLNGYKLNHINGNKLNHLNGNKLNHLNGNKLNYLNGNLLNGLNCLRKQSRNIQCI